VMRYPTVFIDRDGVINRMRSDYVKSWAEFETLPGVLDAISRLTRSGREVIVLTNQSAIGHRLVAADVVDRIHSRLAAEAAERGGLIRAFLICPHTPSDGCSCRKPAPGLFFRARDELGVELPDAVMVGDQAWDIQAASAAGCDAILVDAKRTEVGKQGSHECPVVANLVEAADLICGQ
jgi:D-glycero-D-manno-heptose 1,7-bisphosphate phosphatase